MKLLQLQRPLNWLWTALGIVKGANPSLLQDGLVATVEAMQNGLGMAKDEVILLAGSLAGGVQQLIGGDPLYAYLVRLSATNSGSANVLLTVQLIDPTQSVGPVIIVSNVPAATTWGWWSMTNIHTAGGIGAGNQFIYVPPGWRLLITLAQFTTTAGNAQIHTCRVPAGTRPW